MIFKQIELNNKKPYSHIQALCLVQKLTTSHFQSHLEHVFDCFKNKKNSKLIVKNLIQILFRLKV
jgi:hypothetical protein